MLFSAYLLPLTLSISGTIGGRVPVTNGVIGGVLSVGSSTKPRLLNCVNATTPGKIRVVENSGICETTPGVFQASGYGDLTATESIWFWFFASRKNPDTAPLTLWFNGGPGSSSMIGLLQENGPCRITNDSSSVTHNPFSWNNEANVLYIDQPVGTGFSHGDLKVETTQQAAADVWTFIQIFLSDSRFSKYQKNNLAIWTESYGGHYGPAFAVHFLAQNAAIAAGTISGLNLNLKVLGIGDGLMDPLLQYASYMTYAAHNPYHPLVSAATIELANSSWTSVNGCRAQITACYKGGINSVCSAAQSFCNTKVLAPLASDFNADYILSKDSDSDSDSNQYPPNITDYLNLIGPKIGAETTWQQSNIDIYGKFAATGDVMRNSRPDLETVINAGIRTILYVGDADFLVNFDGVEAIVNNLSIGLAHPYEHPKFHTYTVAGHRAGKYKNIGTFSYIRVFGAGHEVPAYKYGNLATGQAAAQIFTQIMSNQPLTST